MEAKVAGILLVIGAAVFFGLGFGSLAIAGDTPLRRAWIAGVFSVAAVLAAVAVHGLASGLRGTPAAPWLEAAAVLLLLATPLLFASMAHYAGVTTALPSTGPGHEGPRPAVEEALAQWGEALVSGYMVLAFAAMALVGAGLLQVRIAPPWAAWLSLGLGAFLTLTYPLKWFLDFWIADLPLWAHVWGAAAGAALLLGEG